MEREILFRGKRLDNGDWIVGWYCEACFGQWPLLPAIIPMDDARAGYYRPVEVDHATIGQYTGLKDKSGKRIFEGDILRVPAKNSWEEKNFVGYEVFFHDNDCADRHVGWQMNRQHFYGALCGGEYPYSFLPRWTNRMIVIGNIHDNPELLTS